MVQARGHGGADPSHARLGHRAAAHLEVEPFTLDELERQPRGLVGDAGVEQGDDAGMAQGGEQTRLVAEASGIDGPGVTQHLERDVATEDRVVAAVDVGHPAVPDGVADLVAGAQTSRCRHRAGAP